MLNCLKCLSKIDGKKTGIFAAGVLFGTAGIKILSSREAKKVYTNCTAAALRAKECIMNTASTIQENAEDIYAENIEYAGLASAPVELGDVEYFVIGDNPGVSDDSRSPDAGPVREADIYGKAWFVTSFGDNFGLI